MCFVRRMAIVVRQTENGEPMQFEVEVREANGRTHHRVTMTAARHAALGKGAAPEAVIRAAFAFLLEREPKESILATFDVTVISRYFPEFERAIGRYLSH